MGVIPSASSCTGAPIRVVGQCGECGAEHCGGFVGDRFYLTVARNVHQNGGVDCSTSVPRTVATTSSNGCCSITEMAYLMTRLAAACAAPVGWHGREDFGGVQTATGVRDLAARAANRLAAHR